ncbi:hypothetical protein Vafri_2789 [Volvox africanus]|uniref:Rad4 beta-hairpin domain-containing protein n=1 Tax=Volvox africanus TaxID=51714 RepID=A0A8J4AQJ4_9CHLO|nr:hypothetical protein Vafri_2789 [Volvox africanus]
MMAYGGTEDLEWEEVEEEDWEVICVDDEQKQGAHRTGIEFTLDELEGPERRAKRIITKREREAATAVHRSHVLCLLARVLLLDWAAEQPVVQATALSLMSPAAALVNQSAEEAQRAINGMLPLVTWFRSTFAVLPPDLVWGQEHRREGRRGSSLRVEDELDEQLLRTARSQAGTVECLVALFVALVRAQGGSARVVRLLDTVPLAPWRAKPLTVRTAAAPSAPPLCAGAATGGSRPRLALDLEAGDLLPTQAATATGQKSGSGSREAASGAKKGRQLEEVLVEKGYGVRKGKRQKVAAGGEGGSWAGGPGEGVINRSKTAARSKSSPAAAKGATESAEKSGGKGQKRGGGDIETVAGCNGIAIKAAAERDGSGAELVAAGGAAASRSNKGEEEFERQLQMALLATSMDAAAGRQKQQAEAGADKAGEGGTGSSRSQFRRGGGGKVAGSGSVAGASSSGSGAPVGTAMSVRPEVVVNCWAEVYCGSVARGRWVAVDVANGYVDRPELVDSATLRPTPVCYVVASERGALLDVTARYCHNLLAAQRNRDETWWATTAERLQRVAGRCLGRAMPFPDAATVAADLCNDLDLGDLIGKQAEEKRQGIKVVAMPKEEDGSLKVMVEKRDANGKSGASCGGGPRIIDARLSHQRAEMENALGPNAAAVARAASPSASVEMAGPSASGSAARSVALGQAVRSGCQDPGGVGSSGADLRAAREAAELQHRGLSQLQGLPTSIEGFKSHPLYVLKRHIGKYEALRPGTVPLGLHRGEPYYPRPDLSVLHTVERWRRVGRQVRDLELGAPAKVVKKRLMGGPGAAATGPGTRRTTSMNAGGKLKDRAGGGGVGGDDGVGEADDDFLMLETAGEAATAGASGTVEGPTINLYGRWQTDEWIPPVAEGGIVPKNERGNVECPPLVPALPRGTVHITLGPGLGGVCRTLGIDYAPGLVGFEIQGGRMVPKVEGVVVCEEVSELVVAAYLERESARAAAAAARLRRAATAAWLRLLRALRVRLQLERDYADVSAVGDHGVSTAARAAAPGGSAATAVVAAAAAAAGRDTGMKPRGAVAAVAAAAGSAAVGYFQTRHPSAAAVSASEPQTTQATETAADVEVEEF